MIKECRLCQLVLDPVLLFQLLAAVPKSGNGRLRTGATSGPAPLLSGERTCRLARKNNVIGSDWYRAGAGVDIAARRRTNTPSEREAGPVDSRNCFEDFGADIRRSHVNDPAYRNVPPLAARIPLDARERE